jgi:hypothetical protein
VTTSAFIRTGRNSALRRRFQSGVYPHLAGAIRHSNSNFQAFVASKAECDSRICLNLGFTSQNFRLSQVSLRVFCFSFSSFRMDEGNPCLVSRWSADDYFGDLKPRRNCI